MELTRLTSLLKKEKTKHLIFEGKCHDCATKVKINAEAQEEGVNVTGGAIYEPIVDKGYFLKCEKCYSNNSTLRNFKATEVYSRIVGYYRPIKTWNEAQQAQFKDRKVFNIN